MLSTSAPTQTPLPPPQLLTLPLDDFSTEENSKSGLFCGELRVPLDATKINAKVTGVIADVEVTQLYANSTAEPMQTLL